MRTLFVHQNIPGQFGHLISNLAAASRHEVRAIGQQNKRPVLVPTLRYPPPEPTTGSSALRTAANLITRAELAAGEARKLKESGFVPDLIIGHFAWGEMLFLKDIWPGAGLLVYADFFYNPGSADDGFDPEFRRDDPCRHERQRAINAILLGSLSVADAIWVSTRWQASQLPPEYQPRVRIIHEGIPTDEVDADSRAALRLGRSDLRLAAGDEVITFVARDLEPMRGFHTFMRALPLVLAARPSAHVIVIGGDGVSYGRPAPGGKSWRDALLEELGSSLDISRVHFLGRVPWKQFVKVLQISAVHVYLTYPFVLSWSVLEAMAAKCLIVASDTPPVREVIRSGENGILVDFFDVRGLGTAIAAALAKPERFTPLRENARRTIVDRFDLKRVCLPQQMALIESLAAQSGIAASQN